MSQQPATDPRPPFSPALLLPLVAFCLVLPLVAGGTSCGHDFGFHIQSWMDAGEQIRHGHLFPRWAFSPAFNAGEPRFIFYPPISWLLGSVLMLVLPGNAVPTAFTWLALTGAALAMYRLAQPYTTRTGALLAATAYVANPYVLFTAFERTAYAELLSAAWMPLLFRAALAPQLSAVAIAVPVALLWLTNAPAAVMGTYAFGIILLTRLALAWRAERRNKEDASPLIALLLPAIFGLILGFALASFYLLPAAWERRYVQIAMAIIPNMRVEDNFLFGHTGYGPHDQVLHTASMVALELAEVTALVLALAWLGEGHSLIARSSDTPQSAKAKAALLPCIVLAVSVGLMLWHGTLPLWHGLPELQFLQFPWRLLAVMGCVLGLGIALAIGRRDFGTQLAIPLAFFVAAGTSFTAIRPFRQTCDVNEAPATRLALFRAHHGVGATDEYTPGDADNDHLRWDDPGYWLTKDPNAPGPNTVPNPAETIVDYDQPPPLEQTVSQQAPMRLQLHVPEPETLVLNLRDYPTWRVTVNGGRPEHLQRDDGLLALPVPAGEDTVEVHWQTLPDMWLGDALTLAALGVVGFLGFRSRRISLRR